MGKDQPPDLAALVPTSSIVLPDEPEKQPSPQVLIDKSHVSADSKPKAVSGKSLIKFDIQCVFMCNLHQYSLCFAFLNKQLVFFF